MLFHIISANSHLILLLIVLPRIKGLGLLHLLKAGWTMLRVVVVHWLLAVVVLLGLVIHGHLLESL